MIVALGGALSLSCVAEGVETEDQAAIMALMGCRHAQGYYFSPPVSAARISELLASGRRLPELRRLADGEHAASQELVATELFDGETSRG
jgi:predicted signal transduction protein with EAL and GGDEF domain